jgi:hypothetical protein
VKAWLETVPLTKERKTRERKGTDPFANFENVESRNTLAVLATVPSKEVDGKNLKDMLDGLLKSHVINPDEIVKFEKIIDHYGVAGPKTQELIVAGQKATKLKAGLYRKLTDLHKELRETHPEFPEV